MSRAGQQRFQRSHESDVASFALRPPCRFKTPTAALSDARVLAHLGCFKSLSLLREAVL